VNRVNSRNDLCHDDSIINIVPGIIIIIIIVSLMNEMKQLVESPTVNAHNAMTPC